MNEQSAHEIRHTVGSSGSLALRNVSGRVRLSGVDGDEVIVRYRAGHGEPRLNVERSTGGLLVEPERHGRFPRIGFDFDSDLEFDVQLPHGARLDIKTVSADIDGRELDGDQRYKTVSGDVRLQHVAGRVSAMTVSGDVRLHDGGLLELDGATTSGDFSIEAEQLEELRLRTVSGDAGVRGRLAAGPRHSVETVSGDLHLETVGGVSLDSTRALDLGGRHRGAQVFGDGSARLSFRTMSGDARVVLADEPAGGQPARTRPAEAEPAASEPERDQVDRLAILRALERGEIDVDEASRRLEGIGNA